MVRAGERRRRRSGFDFIGRNQYSIRTAGGESRSLRKFSWKEVKHTSSKQNGQEVYEQFRWHIGGHTNFLSSLFNSTMVLLAFYSARLLKSTIELLAFCSDSLGWGDGFHKNLERKR
eukprot:1144158-Pelagomonas_calceolata.AAC.1